MSRTVDGLSVLACGGLEGYRQSLFGIAAAPKEGKEFVREASKPLERHRKHPIRPKPMEGADWGDRTVFPGMRGQLLEE
ncbi:MAG: hypothetical protein ACLFTU_01870 [Puniceicoccaceae bacterium]